MLTVASIPQVLEGAMLVCFGISWPVAILKTYRSKRTEGKSRIFLVLVLIGYMCGIVSKFFRASDGVQLEWVTALYALNAVMVVVDLVLVIHFRRLATRQECPTLPDYPPNE